MSDEQTQLPAALSGQRRELNSGKTGRLSWYQDGPPPGAASGRPLLLIHTVNAAASAYEVKPLYEHYRHLRPVYAPDLPGYGFSSREDRPYTPRLMTDAIHALLAEIHREHGPGPVDAIGVSLGSEFLARAAAEAPESFGSVTLVSPTGFNAPTLREGAPGSTRGMPGVRAVLTRPSWARRLFGLLTRRPVIRYFLERTWGSRNIDEGMLDYDYATTRPVGAEHAPLNFLSGFLFSADSGQVYRALKQPVLVVHGVRGDFTDYRGTKLMADKPNWTIDVLQTGALPHFEMPTQFIERYEAWRAKSA